MTEQLLEQWNALVQKTVDVVGTRKVYLPRSERRGIADQFGLDNWQEADEMIDRIEAAHNGDKQDHLERLQKWPPPEDAASLDDLIDRAVAFLRDHPAARHFLPLGLDAVTDFLKAAKTGQK